MKTKFAFLLITIAILTLPVSAQQPDRVMSGEIELREHHRATDDVTLPTDLAVALSKALDDAITQAKVDPASYPEIRVRADRADWQRIYLALKAALDVEPCREAN